MQLSETVDRRTKRLFVTYAREDREHVLRLRAGLERLRHEVWVDDRLSVGQAWWQEILSQIRTCDAVVVAVSPALLESHASRTERAYARALGRVFLPILVRAVRPEFLPDDLAPLQIVDYCTPGPEAAFELAEAVSSLPPPVALPDPLPADPDVPVSYLNDLTARVYQPNLSLDEQLALVSRLRVALNNDTEREPALELLATLQRRRDLYLAPAREIEATLAALTQPTQPTQPTQAVRHEPAVQRPSDVASGWYPDPTHRHPLRYFDRDWSDWASDGSRVFGDPL